MRLLRSRENLRRKYLEVLVLLIAFLAKLISEIITKF